MGTRALHSFGMSSFATLTLTCLIDIKFPGFILVRRVLFSAGLAFAIYSAIVISAALAKHDCERQLVGEFKTIRAELETQSALVSERLEVCEAENAELAKGQQDLTQQLQARDVSIQALLDIEKSLQTRMDISNNQNAKLLRYQHMLEAELRASEALTTKLRRESIQLLIAKLKAWNDLAAANKQIVSHVEKERALIKQLADLAG